MNRISWGLFRWSIEIFMFCTALYRCPLIMMYRIPRCKTNGSDGLLTRGNSQFRFSLLTLRVKRAAGVANSFRESFGMNDESLSRMKQNGIKETMEMRARLFDQCCSWENVDRLRHEKINFPPPFCHTSHFFMKSLKLLYGSTHRWHMNLFTKKHGTLYGRSLCRTIDCCFSLSI